MLSIRCSILCTSDCAFVRLPRKFHYNKVSEFVRLFARLSVQPYLLSSPANNTAAVYATPQASSAEKVCNGQQYILSQRSNAVATVPSCVALKQMRALALCQREQQAPSVLAATRPAQTSVAELNGYELVSLQQCCRHYCCRLPREPVRRPPNKSCVTNVIGVAKGKSHSAQSLDLLITFIILNNLYYYDSKDNPKLHQLISFNTSGTLCHIK